MARKPADQSVNRDTILAAAADVLARRGYDTATMKEIAAAVNLTAASLYYHFRSKDALMLAVLEMGLDVVIARIESIAGDTTRPPAERLRAMIAAHIAAIAAQPAVGAAMVFEIRDLRRLRPPAPDADADDDAAFADFATRRERFFARRDAFEGLFRVVVAEGVACAVFRPVDVPIFVKALLGANNWVGVWYRPDGRLNGAAIAALYADHFLAALVPRS